MVSDGHSWFIPSLFMHAASYIEKKDLISLPSHLGKL